MLTSDDPSGATRPYERSGFFVVEGRICDGRVQKLREIADRCLAESSGRGGARNLLLRSEQLRREGFEGEAAVLACEVLGPDAIPTKLTLFDKTPESNWLIRWHQDLNIAVKKRREVPGFSAWSCKEGVPHARAPSAVLEKMVAVRLHLDDAPSRNGALRVVPGSHRSGVLTREQAAILREQSEEVTCEVRAGGLMVMSPLLLHASSKSVASSRRRVLHFEYSAAGLPGGLQWA